MTNSTEANKKIPKTKGPLRFEAIIPTVVILALMWAYFHFFFDGHIRKAMEWTATSVHGAEVNIGKINTSVLGASLEIRDIQVTDKDKPQRNIVQVGRVHFKLLWDALLRGKMVVDDASIENIQALSPRKRPGRIVPKTEKQGEVSSKVEKSVINQAQSQFNENVLGDVANVLGGTDPSAQLKNIEGELKASQKIKDLQAELKEKEKAWRERIKNLPQGKEIDEFGQKFKSLKFDSKNPVEFAKSLTEAQKLIKEADKKIKYVSETSKELNKDVDVYSQAVKDVEKMVDQDLRDLQSRLKIPDVNAGEFSKGLFMRLFQQKLASIYKYAEVAKQYMPPKKTAEQKAADKAEQIVPRQRGTGINFRFPITTGYPLFWLKHAKITSTVSSSAEYSGNIEGKVVDLTSDPVYLKRPAIITVKGDFPKQQIMGLDSKIVLDHTGDVGKETMDLKIQSYPVGEQKLSDSKDVTFVINKANGGLELNAQLVGDQVNVSTVNAFTQMDYQIDSKNSMVRDILQKVMAGIPVIDVKARASGTWSNLDFHLNSNLGDEISQGFRREIQAKVDEAKAKLKALINEKIGGEKAKLTAEFDKIKGQMTGEVDRVKSQVEGAKKTAQNQLNQEQKKGGTKKLEEEGKKLLKKFKFGG